MWISRAFGLGLAAAGAALLGFLWSQMWDRSQDFLFIYQIGIPGALALGLLGLTAFFFGVHLVVAPRSAIRHWTPRIRGRG